ncbi:fatty acid--CoA ligase family protein [Candidatus Halobeggiatoa sp. HSG11]|nr:fatty acid--CoA ligase family protein [Candidatus Halobeggiatoa sp. HSG11]
MKFIGQIASGNWQSNSLTDGKLTFSYQEIPELFNKIQTCFSKIEDCIVFQVENTIPCALTLLFLLEKGYSFILLPKENNEFVPKFCRYKLKTYSGTQLEPQEFLHIVENEAWNGEKIASEKLYMRTSGSTGSPKMAVYSHAKLRGNILNCVQRLGLSSNSRVAIPVPLFHMYGLGAAFLPCVATGASIDLQKGANILRFLQREKAFNPNTVFMTPVFCETLLKGRRTARPYDLTVTAGDHMRGDTFAKYESMFGCLVQLYGSTEMGAIAAAESKARTEIRAKTVGKPMQNVQIQLKKATQNTGELWCHHKYSFDGYVDENNNLIDLGSDYQDGWFRTKDYGLLWPNGELEVLGRSDHSINRDGLLVFFVDIEKAIETLKDIEKSMVVSKGESKRGKKLIAHCILAKNSIMTSDDIRTACFNLLPARAVPDNVVIVKSLPLLPNGKIDRQKLVGTCITT